MKLLVIYWSIGGYINLTNNRVVPNRENMAKTLNEIISRRYYSQMKAADEHGQNPLPKEVFARLLTECKDNGFLCTYCHAPLVINDNEPYYFVPSIDHKIPMDLGGPNTEENLCVCCHRCNIIKSTMTDTTYRKLLFWLDQDPILKIKMFDELWRGRRANKVDRVQRTD